MLQDGFFIKKQFDSFKNHLLSIAGVEHTGTFLQLVFWDKLMNKISGVNFLPLVFFTPQFFISSATKDLTKNTENY